MATLFDLPHGHPIIVEAVQDARALVTARIGVTTAGKPGQVDMDVYESMLVDMVEKSFGGARARPYPVLYAAQLAAVALIAAQGLGVMACASGEDIGDLRVALFLALDSAGATF